jgi:FkbM family methyltransferase
VLWDGTRIAHPAQRAGLLEAVQEIWLERIYTSSFYRPSDGDVIVDAGANIGLFAIYVARQNPRCRVIALEPFAENFQYLQANVARACPKNVTCHEVALGAGFGQGEMQAVGVAFARSRVALRCQRDGRNCGDPFVGIVRSRSAPRRSTS